MSKRLSVVIPDTLYDDFTDFCEDNYMTVSEGIKFSVNLLVKSYSHDNGFDYQGVPLINN